MSSYPADEVRDDFFPKADYVDREFHELEKKHLPIHSEICYGTSWQKANINFYWI